MDLTGVITGSTMTELTSPTYTLAADAALETNQKAYTVSTLGGTQTGVEVHNVVVPFQAILARPKSVKAPANLSATAVGLQNVPVNEHKIMTRKGVKVNTTGAYGRSLFETRLVVPAGSPYFDQVELAAHLSLHIGILVQYRQSILSGMITTGSF
jgi:hypothetical protein